MICNEELARYLRPYNEAELFYKRFYEAKNKPEEIRRFLSGIDLEYCKKRVFFLPGYTDNLFVPSNIFYDAFPEEIQITRHNRYNPPFYHMHTFFEMICVLEGHCTNQVEGRLYNMKEGDIMILAPGVSHSLSVFDDSQIVNVLIKKVVLGEKFFSILSAGDNLATFFTQALYTAHPHDSLLVNMGDDRQLWTLLENLILEILFADDYTESMKQALLLALLNGILRNHKNQITLSETTKITNENMSNILQFIQNHFKTVTLQETADQFNYSTPYLSKLISLTTARSFSEIVREIKIDKARNLLVSTKLSMEEIAEQIGYENAESFTRLFKRYMHLTPSEYRKHYRNRIGEL